MILPNLENRKIRGHSQPHSQQPCVVTEILPSCDYTIVLRQAEGMLLCLFQGHVSGL